MGLRDEYLVSLKGLELGYDPSCGLNPTVESMVEKMRRKSSLAGRSAMT
jgi:hypothetical protein